MKTLFLIFFWTSLIPTYSQDARTLIQKSEEVRRGIESSQANMTMRIVRPDWSREMSLKFWAKGDDYALILVTAPARDEGTATLKRDNEVWSWMPRIERTIKLPPSMMSQSWMGSDFKNDDLVRENSLIDDYTHRLLGKETLEGRVCYKIELIPKAEAAVVWGKVIMWIDQQDFLQLKSEFYDEDEILVNVMTGSDIRQMGGKTLATQMTLEPVEEEGHQTILIYHDIVFDQPIKESFFTVQNMKRVR